MTDLKIAYLGPEGTFSEMAADAYTATQSAVYAKHAIVGFKAIFEALVKDLCDVAIVPVENAIEGVVAPCMDYLIAYDGLQIISELYLPIHHVLLSESKCNISDLSFIYSHPQALAQCRTYLSKHCAKARLLPVHSTAYGAEILQDDTNSELGAVVGPESLAARYGFEVIARDIQDISDNKTRFLILSKDKQAVTGRDKTSIIITLDKNEAGGLYRVLSFFNDKKINLTRIESRPCKTQMGEYSFCIDFEGHQDDVTVKECLACVQEYVQVYKSLGSYPLGD